MKKIPSLVEALAEIPDFRQPRGKRYQLVSLLVLMCVAMMSGCRSQAAMAEWGRNYGGKWLKRLGIKGRRGPSQATVHRVLKAIPVDKLEGVITKWANQVLEALPCPKGELEGLAIDGKTLCGSKQQGVEESHLVSVLSQRLGIVIAQLGVASKTNEIPIVEKLLESLVIRGRVVTVDALLTQRAIAQAVLAGGGDYLMTVKHNQPTLRDDIQTLFQSPLTPPVDLRWAETTDLHGNRIEQRRLCVSTDVVGYCDWPGLAQVMQLERIITHKDTGKVTREVVYGITSLTPEQASASVLLNLWRQHWSIENKLHYVRDVTFDEDRSQVRTAQIPQALAALRNAAISLLRLMGAHNIAAQCRLIAARPQLAFAALGLLS
jgi:predicted transposase YbfD/YdcC